MRSLQPSARLLLRLVLMLMTVVVSPVGDLVGPSVGTSAAYAAPAEITASGNGYAGAWVWIDWSDPSMMNDLTVGWVRLSLHWDMVEANPGAYNWIVDHSIANASGDGKRQVLVNIRNNPSWAAGSRCNVTTEPERARLSAFVSKAVERYRDRIPDGPVAGRIARVKYWELYNEPDNTSEAFDTQHGLGGCFGTAVGTTATQQGRDNYALMLESAARAVRSADAEAKVVFGGQASGSHLGTPGCDAHTGCIFDRGFLKGALSTLKARGSLDLLDVLSVHMYSSQSGLWARPGASDIVIGRAMALREEMAEVGLSGSQMKPIIVTEGGFTSMTGSSTSDPASPFNQAQRNYVPKTLARAAYVDILAFMWFMLRDTPTGLGSSTPYGLLDQHGARKPSYAAFKYFTSLVNGRDRFRSRLDLTSLKLEGYEFVAVDGRRFHLVWNETDDERIAYTPTGSAVLSVTDPMGGGVSPMGNTVAVGAEPRYIFVGSGAPAPTPSPGPGTCTGPRKIQTTPQTIAPGQVRVTVSVVNQSTSSSAFIRSVRFGSLTNARVDIDTSRTASSGSEWSVPANQSQIVFTVSSIDRSKGVMVPFTVVDDCGSWPTFVGGGSGSY